MMTNEEKAKELAEESRISTGESCEEECYDCAMLMAEWKEQQLIDKACEWLRNNIDDYYITNEFESYFDDMLADFKQAMKEP